MFLTEELDYFCHIIVMELIILCELERKNGNYLFNVNRKFYHSHCVFDWFLLGDKEWAI